MGCCGNKDSAVKTALKRAGGFVKQATRILYANAKAYITDSFLVEGEGIKTPLRNERLAICYKCPEITFLTVHEYLDYIKEVGEKEFLLAFADDELASLPPLPKKDMVREDAGSYMFRLCSICKCRLPAKCSLKDSECPIGKWKKEV